MASESAEEVIELVELVRDASPVGRNFLPDLGVHLPRLRRPRGLDGDRDVARYRALPPALRAATIFEVLTAEVANGGVDQFVWNQFSILAETIDGLLHIGADQTAALLASLGAELWKEREPAVDEEIVQAFMAFRERVAVADTFDRDVVDDVAGALERWALGSPEEFVLQPVETREWRVGDASFRTTILRRPDDRFEVVVYKSVLHATKDDPPTDVVVWHELARDAELLQSLGAARELAAREKARRLATPTDCRFEVAEWSEKGTYWPAARLWSNGDLSVDLLPIGVPLAVTLQGDGRRLETTGRFLADRFEPRYGHIWLDTDPPGDAGRCRGWFAECRVRPVFG